ncbi:hypothetical protein ARMSODRAFT_972616 [Armillaria solidipes]|uniref:Uncharacterized protein n=1 Tax=Armillaria solidipes TaxID=1076256 RepID=A0A2H3BQF3_9AGAR|nr:hypothetical protein ARMSODRAFT_972616 [Armillaria solidipes]
MVLDSELRDRLRRGLLRSGCTSSCLGVYEIVGRISRMYKVVKVCKSHASWIWKTTTGVPLTRRTLTGYRDTKELSIIPFLTLTIKDSWLITAAEVGQCIFRGVSCCFEVVAAYEVKDRLGAPITTRRLVLGEILSTGFFTGRPKEKICILLKAKCLTPERRQLLGNSIAMLVDDNKGIEEVTTTKEVSEPGTRHIVRAGNNAYPDIHRTLNVLCKEAFREYLDDGFRALECKLIKWWIL